MLLDIYWPNNHCNFMAQLKNITLDKTSFVLFGVVNFQSNSSGRIDAVKRHNLFRRILPLR